MKDYNKTLWEDNVTLISAERMNNIEEQVDLVTDKLLEVESNLNDNIDALDQACTAITGEKFNSIDERIDSEINRLNHKIEVSMLQQENKESHIIENSIEGITTDMIIRGRTLQNIIKMKDFSLNNIGVLENNIFKINRASNSQTTAIALAKKFLTNLKSNTVYTVMAKVYNNTLTGDFALIHQYQNTMFTKNPITIPQGFNGIVCKKFTTIDDIKLGDRIEINFQLVTGTVDIQNLIILEGDYTNTFFDEYFEGIKSFGEEENKISILSSGKNLLKPPITTIEKQQGTVTYSLNNEGILTINGNNSTTGGGRHLFSDIYKCNVKKGKTYTLSYEHINGTTDDEQFPLLLLTNYYNHNDLIGTSKKSITFTADADKILFCGANIAMGKSYSNYKIRIFLEESGEFTKYEPYIENKKDILLNNYGFTDGLKSIFNVHDELNSIDNITIKRIDKHTFNGNEIWQKTSVEEGTEIETIRFQTALRDAKNNAGNKMIVNFPTLPIGTWGTDAENIQVSNGIFYIRIKKDKLESQNVEGFCKWLKANPITVYYELLEPIETPLNKNINLKTFNDKCYIDFKNDIKGTSTFKSPVDVKQTLSTLKKENEDIKTILNSILESLKNQEK